MAFSQPLARDNEREHGDEGDDSEQQHSSNQHHVSYQVPGLLPNHHTRPTVSVSCGAFVACAGLWRPRSHWSRVFVAIDVER